MKKRSKFVRVGGFILLSIALQILLFELYGRYKGATLSYNPYESQEVFDPSLIRLNNLDKLENYCDSIYGTTVITDTSHYANIVGSVVRERFFHGYSYYRLGQNFIGWALAPYIKRDLSAIVIPDDILTHPNAACSQQSIIGMMLFKRKGISTRKVGFYDPGSQEGHFCFEAYYNDKWHFFDTDKEPVRDILEKNGRPSIADLVTNRKLMDSVYYLQDSSVRNGYLLKYSYGPINKFPAPKAKLYQLGTKFLSWTLFFWLIVFGWWVWKRFNV